MALITTFCQLSGCTPEAKYFIDRELHPKAIRYGPNVVEALRLLSPDDEVEGQQALSIIGALDQIDNAIWDAGEPGGYTPTVEEALALPESNIRVLHGCSMGCLFESGYCDGPAGFGSGAFVSFGCCFYVITNMLPILEAATGGRVPPRRLWELAMSRGCLEPHSSYGLPRVDYGPTIDYMVHDPCLFGTLTTEFGTLNTKALASLEEIGNPNDIADVIRDRGFWMWMRPDRFPIGSSTCASTSTTVVRPVEFMSKASIMNLPLELLHSVALQLPLSSITTLARINRTMYHQFLQARDALAKVYMRMQARWCLPFGEAERRWWDERNGDDALGWDYLKRCCSESYSMRNRRRIWRTAESIEEECEREEAKRANEDCVASI
ncbi:hypothetical protein BDV93DRAFT_524099 [Ceratobasidium sp. AG-I]|nr:hypothetical protein BDV93DRAFT_524099 [Ceratobasidium sp. AG-I]